MKEFSISNFQFSINSQFFNYPMRQGNYDLEERTAVFGENVIQLCKSIRGNPVITPIISQLVRSATSVGANYMEASGASSRKDFRNKIFIRKKEVQETKHWLRMLVRCIDKEDNDIMTLRKECHELTLIFQKITMSLKQHEVVVEN